MTNRVDTPSISSDLSDEESQRLFNESVKECVEVLEGKRGDGLDRALTARDLAQAGILTISPASLYSGGSSSGISFGSLVSPFLIGTQILPSFLSDSDIKVNLD